VCVCQLGQQVSGDGQQVGLSPGVDDGGLDVGLDAHVELPAADVVARRQKLVRRRPNVLVGAHRHLRLFRRSQNVAKGQHERFEGTDAARSRQVDVYGTVLHVDEALHLPTGHGLAAAHGLGRVPGPAARLPALQGRDGGHDLSLLVGLQDCSVVVQPLFSHRLDNFGVRLHALEIGHQAKLLLLL